MGCSSPDIGFLVKKAKVFNLAHMLDHLKIPEGQNVMLLK